jgi:hypothetical protein
MALRVLDNQKAWTACLATLKAKKPKRQPLPSAPTQGKAKPLKRRHATPYLPISVASQQSTKKGIKKSAASTTIKLRRGRLQTIIKHPNDIPLRNKSLDPKSSTDKSQVVRKKRTKALSLNHHGLLKWDNWDGRPLEATVSAKYKRYVQTTSRDFRKRAAAKRGWIAARKRVLVESSRAFDVYQEAYFKGLLDAYNGVFELMHGVSDVLFFLFLIRTAPSSIFNRLKSIWAEIHAVSHELRSLFRDLAHIRVIMSYRSLDIRLYTASVQLRLTASKRDATLNGLKQVLKASRLKQKLQHNRVFAIDRYVKTYYFSTIDTRNFPDWFQVFRNWLEAHPELLAAEAFALCVLELLHESGAPTDIPDIFWDVKMQLISRTAEDKIGLLKPWFDLQDLVRKRCSAMLNIYQDIHTLSEELRMIRYYRIRFLDDSQFAAETACDRRFFLQIAAAREPRGRRVEQQERTTFRRLRNAPRLKLNKAAMRAEVAFMMNGSCE